MTFRSGGGGWVRADSVAEGSLGRLIFVLAGPVTMRVPRRVGKAIMLAPARAPCVMSFPKMKLVGVAPVRGQRVSMNVVIMKRIVPKQ